MDQQKRALGKHLICMFAVLFLIGAGFLLLDGRHTEISLQGEPAVVLEYGETFTDPGAEAFCVGKLSGTTGPLPVSVSAVVDTGRLGTTEIVYSASYHGHSAQTTRSVTVRDTTPPAITLLNTPGKNDFTARDNFDGDITARVQRTEETGRILYTVSDSSGNTATEERLTAPVIVLNGGDSVAVTADYRFIDPGCTAADCYGQDLTDRVLVEGTEQLTPWKTGFYELTYSVEDDFGNTASVRRQVEIVAAELPETVVQEKVIYLTFDDGPAKSTAELLDILAEYDAKATFFVTAADKRYSDMIGRAYAEGHSIGVHAYNHAADIIYISEEAYFDNFAKIEELIYEQTGEYTRLVRFVGGSSNTSSRLVGSVGIMSRLAEDLTTMGYRYYDWNIQPENAKCDVNAAYRTIIGLVPYLETPIILQHDTAQWNCAVVRLVLQWGKENGYTFKGLDMTTPEVHHHIVN